MLPPLQLEVEPVGRSYLIHYLQELVYKSTHANDPEPQKKKKSKNKKGKKGKAKKGKNDKMDIEIEVDWDCPVEDYYALLGIKKYQFNISADDLKKACYVQLFRTRSPYNCPFFLPLMQRGPDPLNIQ